MCVSYPKRFKIALFSRLGTQTTPFHNFYNKKKFLPLASYHAELWDEIPPIPIWNDPTMHHREIDHGRKHLLMHLRIHCKHFIIITTIQRSYWIWKNIYIFILQHCFLLHDQKLSSRFAYPWWFSQRQGPDICIFMVTVCGSRYT